MRRAALLVALAMSLVLACTPVAGAHVLTFANARAAAKTRADAYARQPTRITMLTQLSIGIPHLYYAQAEWYSRGPYGISELNIIALRVRCLHAHSRANAKVPCRAFAWVTDLFA